MIKLTRVNLDVFDLQNKIVNFVKAKHSLRNKGSAINFIIEQYGKLHFKELLKDEFEESKEIPKANE